MEKYVHIADEGAMIVMGRYEQPVQEQSAYQSEAVLEESLLAKLVSIGYERLHITSEADLLLNLRRQLEALKAAWPGLKEKIRAQIIPFDEVHENLRLVGAPYEPEMICVDRARMRRTFSYIPYMRSRFTNIDVVYRLGLMPELTERLFGKGGIWEVK